MKTIEEIVKEILEEESSSYLLKEDDDVEINDEPVNKEEVNNYIKMQHGRYRNKQVKFSLTENEYTLFKEKLAKDNMTIQKKLHSFVLDYILN